jgi:hypothetical protein
MTPTCQTQSTLDLINIHQTNPFTQCCACAVAYGGYSTAKIKREISMGLLNGTYMYSYDRVGTIND